MKLRNKKTNEVVERVDITIREVGVVFNNDETYNSLAELNEEWEDYEEPKEYWIIDTILHEIRSLPYKNNEEDKRYEQWLEELGLKFETKEEAEKAIEKLKAWKRLRDKGFEFRGYEIIDGTIKFMILPKGDYREKVYEDLDICFGGEE